jgi:hypothetical protein
MCKTTLKDVQSFFASKRFSFALAAIINNITMTTKDGCKLGEKENIKGACRELLVMVIFLVLTSMSGQHRS